MYDVVFSLEAAAELHDSSHIPAGEFFVRRVAIEYDERMFSNHSSGVL